VLFDQHEFISAAAVQFMLNWVLTSETAVPNSVIYCSQVLEAAGEPRRTDSLWVQFIAGSHTRGLYSSRVVCGVNEFMVEDCGISVYGEF
jgi:hypothetical protein